MTLLPTPPVAPVTRVMSLLRGMLVGGGMRTVMEGGREEDEDEEPVSFLIRPPMILSGVGRASKKARVLRNLENSQR